MHEDFYIQLIIKDIDEAISSSEKEQLDSWLNQSEDNQDTATAIRLVWDKTAPLSPEENPDINLEFEKLDQRILEKESVPEIAKKGTSHRRINFRPLLIAASIGLIIFFGISLFRTNSQTLVWQELTTTNNSAELLLQDKTQIVLNANSVLRYPKEFVATERKIFLDGEGYFEVTHDPEHPFIIETPMEEIKVLGTSFYVKTDETKESTIVFVRSGKVEFKSKSTNQAIFLLPREKGAYNRLSQNISKESNASQNEFSWHSGQLDFEGLALNEVMKQLNSFYQVNLELLEPSVASCPVTMSFQKQSLDMALESLATVFAFELVKLKDGHYQLKGGKCE